MTGEPAIVATSGRESRAVKAARLLVERRVRISLVRSGRCWATVNGDSGIYEVGCSRGEWHCTCAAYGTRCSHIDAVKAVVDLRGREDAS